MRNIKWLALSIFFMVFAFGTLAAFTAAADENVEMVFDIEGMT